MARIQYDKDWPMAGIQKNMKYQETGIEMAVSSAGGAAHRSRYRSYRIGRVTTLHVQRDHHSAIGAMGIRAKLGFGKI